MGLTNRSAEIATEAPDNSPGVLTLESLKGEQSCLDAMWDTTPQT